MQLELGSVSESLCVLISGNPSSFTKKLFVVGKLDARKEITKPSSADKLTQCFSKARNFVTQVAIRGGALLFLQRCLVKTDTIP